MASLVSAAGWSRVLSAITGQATVTLETVYMSLHTAAGSSNTDSAWHTTETSGGTPAYARVTAAFNAPSAGSITNNGSIAFNVGGTSGSPITITNWGLWDSQTLQGGTDFLMGGALSASATFNAQGTLTFANSTGLTISGN